MNDDELRLAFDDLLEPLPPLGALPARTARRAVRRRQLKLGAAGAGGVGALVLAAVLVLMTGTGGSSSEELRPAPFATPTPSPSSTPTPEPSGPPSPAPSTTASPAPSPGATTGPSAPTQTEAPAEPVDISVVLRPDGLGFTDGGSSSSSLAFGSDADTVRAAVDRALGEGVANELPDCAPGVIGVQYDRFSLLLREGEFVGWSAAGPGPTTGDGIGVGSSLAELRASFAEVTVTEGTVGAEWSTSQDGLAGFLDGTSESSSVTGITAGYRCVFR